MRTLVLVLFFVAIPLAGGSLKPEMEAEFWKSSGLDLALAQRFINERDCGSGALYKEACRRALRAGAEIRGLQLTGGVDSQLQMIWEGKDQEWVMGRVLNALLNAFDPYAHMVPVDYLRHLLEGGNKTEYGTGLETEANGAGLFVFGVFPNSPAASAGLRVHDRIVSINGQPLMGLSAAHNGIFKLQGQEGETVDLEIERAGRRFRVSLPISPVVVPEERPQKLEFFGKHYLHLRLRSFRKNICADVKRMLIAAGSTDGLLLDLRHNRGGVVDEAECIVRLFKSAERVIEKQPYSFDLPEPISAIAIKPAQPPASSVKALFPRLALVVLVNAKSASASEITAGALQDLDRAWIVGERTYGKGTTQVFGEISGYPKLRVSRTVSTYFRPSGLGVHAKGITPNFEVYFRAGASLREQRVLREENAVWASPIGPYKDWVEPHAGKVARIRFCMQAVPADSVVASQLGYADHQLAAGLAVLRCGKRGS